MTGGYFYQGQIERLIAVGRVILVAWCISSIWHHLDGPAKYPLIAYYLLAGYLCYAIVLVLTMRTLNIIRTTRTVILHALDLTAFALFVFFTGGPAAPLYICSAYFLACASLRWQMRGAVLTMVIIIGAVIVCTLYPINLLRDPQFEMVHFINQLVSIAILAILFGNIGAYAQQRRSELAYLASWPRTLQKDLSAMMHEVLEYVSTVLVAPHILVIWEEREEPWLHVASWYENKFSYTRETPCALGDLVAEPLTRTNFLCRHLLASKTMVLHTSPSSPRHFQWWQGAPLNSTLQERFPMKTVLSLVLQGSSVDGRLFAIDRTRMASSDLLLGEIVSRAISHDLDEFYLLKQLQSLAAMEERSRMARDLHDGPLQNLAGIILQLELAHQLSGGDAENAQRLAKSRDITAAAARDVRSYIHQLKQSPSRQPELDGDLTEHLKKMAEQINHQWGLRVELDVKLHRGQLAGGLAQGVYFIVREAIINAARHAKASSVKAEISSQDDQTRIAVTDNGCGFLFRGRHDHVALTRMNQGPVSLMERVASLRGSLIIESGDSGSRLEIVLPLPR